MADTSVCNIANFTVGNLRAVVYSITVGANVTMAVETGMNTVAFLGTALQSCTTVENMAITARQGAAGTAIASMFAVSGCTDGDILHVIAYGN